MCRSASWVMTVCQSQAKSSSALKVGIVQSTRSTPITSLALKEQNPYWSILNLAELEQALRDALAESAPRPPLYRALMQADVWAAYDILSRVRETNSHRERARQLMGILQQFILKLALTSEEIAALPHNYSISQSEQDLPDVFNENSGWMEIEWLASRLHDESADHRRAARVFLKPAMKPQKFLTDLNTWLEQRKYPMTDQTNLDGAALVTEDLLIDSHGRVVPSPITTEVQLRTFVRDGKSKFKETLVTQYELSRKLLLANPSSGGFVRLGGDFPCLSAIRG